MHPTPTAQSLPHPPWWQQPALLRRIFADPQPVLDELSATHGPVVGLGAGPVRMAIVGDPTALRELFGMSTDAFRWGHKFDVLGFVVGAELILWSAYLAGRDSTAWDDPLRFDPDRFASPSPEREALARLAWVPFGRGARNCIGFALAQMELTLIGARLAQRIDIEPTGAALPKPVGMVVNRPTGGALLRVAARR